MKIVVAPDSFKGSLTAARVAAAVSRGLRSAMPDAEIVERPLADGGEGTLEALVGALASQGVRRRQALVRNAAGTSTEASYALFRDGIHQAALIEVAQIVGVEAAENASVAVAARSTEGVGELIRILLDEGIRRFYVGLGGTSTNDGGAGMLSALGLRLIGTFRRPVAPTPEGLAGLISIDATGLDPRLAQCEFRLLTDVDRPLLGPHGASATFGPQKGATAAEVAAFDRTLEHFADRLEAALGKPGSIREMPGTGAAGGLGYALQIVGGRFESGAEAIARLTGFEAACTDAHWLITGEGRSDAQTLAGKAPLVAARLFRKGARPGAVATLLSGGLSAASMPALEKVFDGGCFSIVTAPMALAEAIAQAEPLLERAARQLARLRTSVAR